MSYYCDLHTHSVYSDGTYTPKEIIAQAKNLGLAVALTDHNTTAGLPEFMAEAEEYSVNAVPGVELSSVFEKYELHLLGLFIPENKYGEIESLVGKYRTLKNESNERLIQHLQNAGFFIDYPTLKSRAPGGNINRANIAAEMVRQGYVPSINAAFAGILREGNGFYVPPERLKLTASIKLLRKIGAVPVLAHPFKQLNEEELRSIIPSLLEAGLLGIETVHSSYTASDCRKAARIAEDFGLLQSGGSDFHGANSPNITLGIVNGSIAVPYEFFEKLFAKAKTFHCE